MDSSLCLVFSREVFDSVAAEMPVSGPRRGCFALPPLLSASTRRRQRRTASSNLRFPLGLSLSTSDRTAASSCSRMLPNVFQMLDGGWRGRGSGLPIPGFGSGFVHLVVVGWSRID